MDSALMPWSAYRSTVLPPPTSNRISSYAVVAGVQLLVGNFHRPIDSGNLLAYILRSGPPSGPFVLDFHSPSSGPPMQRYCDM